MIVYILKICRNSGWDSFAHQTEQGANDHVADYVRDWWPLDGPDAPIPDDADEMVQAYFDHTGETWSVEGLTVNQP